MRIDRMNTGFLLLLVCLGFGAHETHAQNVDTDWVDQAYRHSIDAYNGGFDGKASSTGMSAYLPDWDGRYITSSDRYFIPLSRTLTTTIRIHGRAVYTNATAWLFEEDQAQRDRLLGVVQKSADYLLDHAADPVHGGYFYNLLDGGTVPTSANDTWKRTQGHGFVVLALAQAYRVTGDADHLAGAFAAQDAINTHLGDAQTGDPVGLPSAFVNGAERAFTPIREPTRRTINDITHVFEGLIALYDATEGAQRTAVSNQINGIGDFVVGSLLRTETADPSRAYLPFNYDADWNPLLGVDTGSGRGTYANNAQHTEWATMLSDARLRGLGDDGWLDAANAMIDFAVEHGFDDAAGGQRHLRVRFDGTPYADSDGGNFAAWEQSELARALLRFAWQHDRDDLWPIYGQVEALLRDHFYDETYGGNFATLSGDPDDALAVVASIKANTSGINYHESLFYAEATRFALATVPEPTSAASLAIGLVACVRHRRRGCRPRSL